MTGEPSVTECDKGVTLLHEPQERLLTLAGKGWLMSVHKENVEEKEIRLSLVYSVKWCGTWQSPSENGWREGVRHNGTKMSLPSTKMSLECVGS